MMVAGTPCGGDRPTNCDDQVGYTFNPAEAAAVDPVVVDSPAK